MSSRWKTTPCSSCSARMKSPICGPRTLSIGRLSGATTWTSNPRARSEAATSSPIKLAPMTTAMRAVLALSMIALQSASERSVCTCGWSAPGIVRRTGSAPVASSKPVVGDRAPVRELDLPALHVDAGDLRLEPQIDPVLGIEAVGPQRHPILLRVAGEVVLGQVRPVDRRRIVVAQHDDASLEMHAPEHLGRGEAGGASADDHDPVRSTGRSLPRGSGFGCFSFSRTKILPSRCSTVQHATGLKAGARKASPVRRSKQA